MKTLVLSAILTLLLSFTSPASAAQGPFSCPPTQPDAQGPFYREGAPVRNEIGEGYLLMGKVRSAADCSPIAGAKIEVWMTGPDGRYDDRWRATLFSNENGGYWFKSHFPGPYGSRPPHIHLIVSAPGYAELVTQHYPRTGAGEAEFNLVLIPES